MKITEKQICEDQIVTFKQSHILLYQGLLFLTRSTCVIVDARSHTCKSHDFIPRYDIIIYIHNRRKFNLKYDHTIMLEYIFPSLRRTIVCFRFETTVGHAFCLGPAYSGLYFRCHWVNSLYSHIHPYHLILAIFITFVRVINYCVKCLLTYKPTNAKYEERNTHMSANILNIILILP